MLRLCLTPKAEADLISIWLYTAGKWGADQADSYIDQLEAGMQQLLAHPRIGADYAHALSNYRRYPIGHHAIFYQFHDSEIRIVRVLHEEMDAPRRLFNAL